MLCLVLVKPVSHSSSRDSSKNSPSHDFTQQRGCQGLLELELEFPEMGDPVPVFEKSCEDVDILVGKVPFQIQSLSISVVINLI